MTGISAINYINFRKVCLTIGETKAVKLNPSALVPAYLIELIFNSNLMDIHKITTKKEVFTSSAQLVSNHTPENITNQQILTVINFPRKQIGKIMSDCLVTGVQRPDGSSEEKRLSTVFMTTTSSVELGARVGILAQNEITTTNIRNLEWHDFTRLDLRIGTIETCLESLTVDSLNKVLFHIHLGGESLKKCAGILQESVDANSFIGRQVLVLRNLDDTSKAQYFGEMGAIDAVLCTVNGRSALTPAIPVENGYKLA